MEINNNLRITFSWAGTIIMIILAALALYFNREKVTILEIKKINKIELTRPLNVDRLSSTYMYDDSIPVEHLWQTSYVIKNTGETTIYGEGFDNKTIRGNSLKLHIRNCSHLLSLDITETNMEARLICCDSLYFTQWRPNEYVELLLLSDGPSAPEITISDRDIQDVKISNVTYSPEEQLVKQRLMDKLPRSLTNALWWITLIVDSFLLLLLLIEGVMQAIKEKSKKERAKDIYLIICIAIWAAMLFVWMF